MNGIMELAEIRQLIYKYKIHFNESFDKYDTRTALRMINLIGEMDDLMGEAMERDKPLAEVAGI